MYNLDGHMNCYELPEEDRQHFQMTFHCRNENDAGGTDARSFLQHFCAVRTFPRRNPTIVILAGLPFSNLRLVN